MLSIYNFYTFWIITFYLLSIYYYIIIPQKK